MDSSELVKTALRVLRALTNGNCPIETDVEILRRAATPSETELSIDDLACSIVRRTCEMEIAESRQERKDIEIIG